jgi:hypothetical protein
LCLHHPRDQHARQTQHTDGRRPEEAWRHLAFAYKL